MTNLPTLAPLGPDAFLIRFAGQFDTRANRAAQIFGRACADFDWVTEIVPALASTLVRFDLTKATRAACGAALQDLLHSRSWTGEDVTQADRCWHMPVSFDTPDAPGLSAAAQMTGRNEERLVEDILDTETTVLAIGFAPGQPYLGILPEHWNFPRSTALTPEVPAGALVAAIRQLVIFANPSPTGWTQVGRVAFRPFQPSTDTPMPLRAGDAIRFHRVDATELAALEAADPMGGAKLERRS